MAKILIIEDDKAINDLMKMNLQLVGYSADQAAANTLILKKALVMAPAPVYADGTAGILSSRSLRAFQQAPTRVIRFKNITTAPLRITTKMSATMMLHRCSVRSNVRSERPSVSWPDMTRESSRPIATSYGMP